MPHELPHGMSAKGLGLQHAEPAGTPGLDMDVCIDDLDLCVDPPTLDIPAHWAPSLRRDLEISWDRPVGDEDGQKFIAFLQEENALSPFDHLANRKWSDEVRRLLGTLTPVEAQIIRWRFGLDDTDELTLKEIGDKYNITRERIRQIQEKALEKIRKLMRDDGSDPSVSSPVAAVVTQQSRELRGRAHHRRGAILVVEVFAGGAPLWWDPSALKFAMVELAGGRSVRASVRKRQTTRACEVAAGASARLAIELRDDVPTQDVVCIRVVIHGAPVTTITLSHPDAEPRGRRGDQDTAPKRRARARGR
jgi:hypothetical protein